MLHPSEWILQLYNWGKQSQDPISLHWVYALRHLFATTAPWGAALVSQSIKACTCLQARRLACTCLRECTCLHSSLSQSRRAHSLWNGSLLVLSPGQQCRQRKLQRRPGRPAPRAAGWLWSRPVETTAGPSLPLQTCQGSSVFCSDYRMALVMACKIQPLRTCQGSGVFLLQNGFSDGLRKPAPANVSVQQRVSVTERLCWRPAKASPCKCVGAAAWLARCVEPVTCSGFVGGWLWWWPVEASAGPRQLLQLCQGRSMTHKA